MFINYKKLQYLLNKNNISKTKLLKKANISDNIITKIKNNQCISLNDVENICKATNFKPNDILNSPFDIKKTQTCFYGNTATKPFLKWAGGKTQLIKEIDKLIPLDNVKITKYAEPFVGGGAMLFHILNNYNIEEVYISDINYELINTYTTIKNNVDDLIFYLSKFQSSYSNKNEEQRKEFYLENRARFNELKSSGNINSNIEKSALMIFLNKTCFNGLYRVNSKGEFNVPQGKYKNPVICDENNLKNISNKLKNVFIHCGSYLDSENFIDQNTFVYFDPPYRPLSNSSNFTSYSENKFGDKEQQELAQYYKKLNKKGSKNILSNSDPKNTNINDNFFDDLYSEFNIKRIDANRMINCKGSSRKKIKELLIYNYNK